MNNDQNNGEGGFYKGLVYGAIIGVGLAWFLGTKEGKKVKKQLSEKSEELIEKAKDKIDSALEDDLVMNDQGSSDLSQPTHLTPSKFFGDKS